MFSSSRHRSSTLKPVKHPRVPLDIVPPPSPQSPQFFAPRPTTPLSAPTAPRPASPAATLQDPHSIASTHHTGGFRAHLAHLLPRHAAFTVTLILHQLHNVPLVHGEFGLKWKIKGVTSHSGNGILDKVKARKAKGKPYERTGTITNAGDPTPSIAKGSDTDNASLLDAASASDAHSIANSSSTHSPSNDHAHSTAGSAQSHTVRTQPTPIPSVVVSANHVSSSPVARSVSGTSSIASVGSGSSISSMSLHADGRFVRNPPGYLSAGWAHGAFAHDNRTLFSPLSGNTTHDTQTQVKRYYSPAKGITPFVKLKDHSVVWEKTLKFVVHMSVGRDNGYLGDCLAKFVVMQRVVAGDPDAPRNPRLGAAYINLAQYVDAGIVTRRYLLRQSKTNATLKLSIHLEHTAGELAYVAPPLPKDEILSGVAGFLESSDVYRTRPRASDLYTRVSSGSSSDDAGSASGSDVSSIISTSGASNGDPSRNRNYGHGYGDGRHGTVKKQRRPFEISKLSTIDDPRGTEKLIEALFNPVPVMQPSKVTPFTYLVEVDGEGDGDGDGDEHGDGECSSYGVNRAANTHEDQRSRPGTVYDKADDDGSFYTDSPDESADKADGTESDYHSLGSYPSSQGSVQSKRSTRSLASQVKLKRDDGGEEMTVSTGVRLLGMERRTWWQKVLSSPITR